MTCFKTALSLAFLIAASPVQAITPVQAAIVVPPPGPRPLLSVAEISQGLDIEPSSAGTWLVFRDHLYYACNARADLQLVLPVFYTFDYKAEDNAGTRMEVAAKTDNVIQSLLDNFARDPFLAENFRSHDITADSGTLDASEIVFKLDAYLNLYSTGKFSSDHDVAFVEYDGLILAHGCGGIDTREKYARAVPQQKYLIQYSYL